MQLNVKKTKGVWLGKWSKSRSTPLQLTWTHDPVKILGIHFSYDEKQNNYHNFAVKIQKLQTNLDLWKSRNLTLFGKVLIMKSIGLSQLVYSASNLNVPIDFTNDTQKKLFSFLWNKKKDKIERECVYQDYEKGGIRMPDLDLVLKALRLAWLPRLLNPVKQNWKSIPDHFFGKLGGLNFLLRCNYDPRYLDPKLPIFYRDILSFFVQVKSRLKQEDEQEIILFNNKKNFN